MSNLFIFLSMCLRLNEMNSNIILNKFDGFHNHIKVIKTVK